MSFQVDHVFVAASRGAPESEALLAAGFAEGPPNAHAGQGTACRRFFFENAYLELAWVDDLVLARSPLVRPTGLADRLGGSDGVSRVGICLRSEVGAEPDVGTWAYRPPYLPEGVSTPVASNSDRLREPLLFFLPAGLQRAPVEAVHSNGARRMSGVAVTVPVGDEMSPELRWLGGLDRVQVQSGSRESVVIHLDDGRRGMTAHLAGRTPLEVRW